MSNGGIDFFSNKMWTVLFFLIFFVIFCFKVFETWYNLLTGFAKYIHNRTAWIFNSLIQQCSSLVFSKDSVSGTARNYFKMFVQLKIHRYFVAINCWVLFCVSNSVADIFADDSIFSAHNSNLDAVINTLVSCQMTYSLTKC